VAVRSPADADLPVIAELCVPTSGKHGNVGWYDPEQLVRFTRAMREHVRVLDIRIGGAIVAASISFVDGPKFHNRAAGPSR
jgi:hypothetical protein